MIRFYTVLIATWAVTFLAQFTEDLGLFGHAVWWRIGDSQAPYGYIVLLYLACAAIVAGVFEIGRWHGRRR